MNDTLAEKQAASRASIEKDFAELEKTFATDQAGLADLLEVYGGYEASVLQAERYLGMLQPAPHFEVSDSTLSEEHAAENASTSACE